MYAGIQEVSSLLHPVGRRNCNGFEPDVNDQLSYIKLDYDTAGYALPQANLCLNLAGRDISE